MKCQGSLLHRDKEPEKHQVWVTWGGEFILPPYNKAYVDVLILKRDDLEGQKLEKRNEGLSQKHSKSVCRT